MSEHQEFIERSFTLMYKQMSFEVKTKKLSKLIKPEQTLYGLSLPFPSQIFIPRVESTITIVSQVLGPANDQYVDELTLGLLFSILIN